MAKPCAVPGSRSTVPGTPASAIADRKASIDSGVAERSSSAKEKYFTANGGEFVVRRIRLFRD